MKGVVAGIDEETVRAMAVFRVCGIQVVLTDEHDAGRAALRWAQDDRPHLGGLEHRGRH
jgi:hypothetical protein